MPTIAAPPAIDQLFAKSETRKVDPPTLSTVSRSECRAGSGIRKPNSVRLWRVSSRSRYDEVERGVGVIFISSGSGKQSENPVYCTF